MSRPFHSSRALVLLALALILSLSQCLPSDPLSSRGNGTLPRLRRLFLSPDTSLNPRSGVALDLLPRSLLAPRAPSSDPSCPEGFLCGSSPCPTTPSPPCDGGPLEVCIRFESSVSACGPSWLKWCALDPQTFEAVACPPEGVCCHGNCYAPGTICCQNPQSQCDVGEACNACAAGEVCTGDGCVELGGPGTTPGGGGTVTVTGSSGGQGSTATSYVGGGGTSGGASSGASTTTSQPPGGTFTATLSTSSAGSTITSYISPTGTLTTTSAAFWTSTLTSSSAAATTSGPPPLPTAVLAYDPFQAVGCFVDSSSARLLPDGAVYDFGPYVNGPDGQPGAGGMTVEKCLDLAESYKYAGVEYTGECYFADEPAPGVAVTQVADEECLVVPGCAGDSTQACGAANRMIAYQDVTWVVRTNAELADAMDWYLGITEELRTEMEVWRDLLDQVIAAEAGGGGAKKRDDTIPLLRAAEQTQRLKVADLLGGFRAARRAVASALRRAMRMLQFNAEEQAIALRVYEAGAGFAEEVVLDNASSLVNLRAVVTRGLALIGPTVLAGAIATLTLAALIYVLATTLRSHLNPGGPPTPSMPTPTATLSASSTSTSSACTYTESPTAFVIMTKQDTTAAEFQALVDSLPKHVDNEEYTASGSPYWLYLATLDRCEAEKALEHPAVRSIDVNAELEWLETVPMSPDVLEKRQAGEGERDGEGPSSLTRRHDAGNSQQQRQGGPRLDKRRNPAAESQFWVQNEGPTHLAQLSALRFFRGVERPLREVRNYMWDEPVVGDEGPGQATVYVIEKHFNRNVPDFAGRVAPGILGAWSVNAEGVVLPLAPPPPGQAALADHGTCMAALVAGRWTGAAKDAELVLVQVHIYQLVQLLTSLAQIAIDIRQRGLQSRAVVSMSWIIPVLPTPETQQAYGQGLLNAFNALWALGAVLVCAAGNNAAWDIRDRFPPRLGGPMTPLIVVANSYASGNPVEDASWDDGGAGVLTLWNNGAAVCPRADGSVLAASGSSLSTALTAGMAAYYLSHPAHRALMEIGGEVPHAQTPWRVKQYLRQRGFEYKGNAWANGVPRAALGEVVPCPAAQAVQKPVPPPQPVVFPAVPPLPVLVQATEGETFILQPAPDCVQLPYM